MKIKTNLPIRNILQKEDKLNFLKHFKFTTTYIHKLKVLVLSVEHKKWKAFSTLGRHRKQ